MVVLFRLNIMDRKYLAQQMVCCFQSLLQMLVSAKKTEKYMIIIFLKDVARTPHLNMAIKK